MEHEGQEFDHVCLHLVSCLHMTSLSAHEAVLTVKFDFIFKSHPTHPFFTFLLFTNGNVVHVLGHGLVHKLEISQH